MCKVSEVEITWNVISFPEVPEPGISGLCAHKHRYTNAHVHACTHAHMTPNIKQHKKKMAGPGGGHIYSPGVSGWGGRGPDSVVEDSGIKN